jgi:hypothetical protein
MLHPRDMTTSSTVPLLLALSPHGDSHLSDSHYSSLPSSPYAAGNAAVVENRELSFDHQTSSKAQDLPHIDPGLTRLDDGASMTEDANLRLRKMSQSSTEREMSTDVKPPRKDGAVDLELEGRGIKRKFSTDIVDYPRRRATIAVRIRSNFDLSR